MSLECQERLALTSVDHQGSNHLSGGADLSWSIFLLLQSMVIFSEFS